MDIFSIISLLGGLAMFLYGMQVMGDGLKRCSGEALKRALEKITHSMVTGALLGVAVTAIIQSSNATIVLTVGLLSAGILNLRQAASIAVGANIGTTVTAQLIRLMDINSSGNSIVNFFKPATLAPIAAIVGIILILFVSKAKRSRSIGEILMGFGILFIGLMNVTSAASPLMESEGFLNLLNRFSNAPLLGLLVGLVPTLAVQSSSAMIGVVQALSPSGAFTFSTVYPVVIGIDLGAAIVTAVLCSIKMPRDAKRVGIIHIVFNVVGCVLCLVIFGVLRSLHVGDNLWNQVVYSGEIANFATLFKFGTAIVVLPFLKGIIRLSDRILKPTQVDPEDYPELRSLNDKLLASPSLAMSQATKAIGRMGELAQKNIAMSFLQLTDYQQQRAERIAVREERMDQFADTADHFLVDLSRKLETEEENKQVNLLMQTVSSFERVGDHATNIEEFASRMQEQKVTFSDTAKAELDVVRQAIGDIMEMTVQAFIHTDTELAKRVEPLEEVVDEMVAQLRDRHIERLKNGTCTINAGLLFLETLTNAERVADMCSDIAVFLLGKANSAIVGHYHEYLHLLHHSQNAEYQAEFKKNTEKYLTVLDGIV